MYWLSTQKHTNMFNMMVTSKLTKNCQLCAVGIFFGVFATPDDICDRCKKLKVKTIQIQTYYNRISPFCYQPLKTHFS